MKHLLLYLTLLATVSFYGCARELPAVLEYEREPLPALPGGNGYSMEAVERAILTACRNKGWSAVPVEPGRIEASITIRSRHRAKIAIPFTTTHYSIQYLDSSGLHYRNGYIHSNYNHWIARLDAEIKKEFGLKTQRY
ncbi:MAG: hypothetical protein Kow0089_11000 [Desulfobulbaceae bacterium]